MCQEFWGLHTSLVQWVSGKLTEQCVLNCVCIFWWWISMLGVSYITANGSSISEKENKTCCHCFTYWTHYMLQIPFCLNFLLRYAISNSIWQEGNAHWRKKITSSKKERPAMKHSERKAVKNSNLNKANKPMPSKLPGYFPEINSLHCLLQMRFNIFPEFAGVAFIRCSKPESTLLNI